MSKFHKNIFILFLCSVVFFIQINSADAKKKKEKDLTPTMRKSLKIDERGHAVIDEQYENLPPDGEIHETPQEEKPKAIETYEQIIEELFNKENHEESPLEKYYQETDTQNNQSEKIQTQEIEENKEITETSDTQPEENQGLIYSFKESIKKTKENIQNRKEKKKKAETPPVEELVPSGDYRFVKYNDLAGNVELDLTNLKIEKQLNTASCISPDFSKMAYSQIYFYPSLNKVASELFYINLDKSKLPIKSVREATIKDRVKIPLLSKGLENANPQIFNTITPVDWSYDSTKLLIKTRYGETQRDLWECSI